MENSWSLIISLIALVFSFFSLFIVHSLNKKRDLINKKKEMRIKYLITAWQLLESASNRHDASLINNLEKAIADIQLFGSLKQIQLSKEFVSDMKTNRTADTSKLLNELRNDLRKELDLDTVQLSDFASLRIFNK
ncbi:hypothetical protein K8P02_00525 [Bacteroides nordii]|uniref:hypothetical protein n=1 Tax=Bacteroides nordii TaxID=291645 RepID=UPI000470664E|nr:hypothetical protein [Bacteroides nordii]UAK42812.1 hypothetical protein K8P02_00525 [Bacteroides nordii]